MVLVARRLVHGLELVELRGVVVPVVLLESPVGVAEEAVMALHTDFSVMEFPTVPRFENTTEPLSGFAIELIGSVCKSAFVPKAALRGLQPILADLRLVVRHKVFLTIVHLWLLVLVGHVVLGHLSEARRRERLLLHRHIHWSARSKGRDESGDELGRGGLK